MRTTQPAEFPLSRLSYFFAFTHMGTHFFTIVSNDTTGLPE